jgi:hypothetical protein
MVVRSLPSGRDITFLSCEDKGTVANPVIIGD